LNEDFIDRRHGTAGHTLQQQLSAQHEVIAPDRSQLDLSDATAITAYVDAILPDLIINPAAYTAVDKAESETELAEAINVTAPAASLRQQKTQYWSDSIRQITSLTAVCAMPKPV
jgi:dTDP-4-dehydrorhamnose reductase